MPRFRGVFNLLKNTGLPYKTRQSLVPQWFSNLLAICQMVRVEGLEPPTSWSQTMRSTNCATPGYCPCAGFRQHFNRRAAGSIVSPELDQDYCPGHMHAESNCAPVAPALAEQSRSRTCLVAQQGGLEPPTPFGAPAFQAGRLPLSHCCILARAGEDRTGTPGPRPPPKLIQKREETAPQSAAGSGGWNRTNPSRVRTWHPADRLRRCMARAGLSRPGIERKKEGKGCRGGARLATGEGLEPSSPISGAPGFRDQAAWPIAIPAVCGALNLPACQGRRRIGRNSPSVPPVQGIALSGAPFLYYADASTPMTLFRKIFGGGDGTRTRKPSFPGHPISSRAPYQFGHPSK